MCVAIGLNRLDAEFERPFLAQFNTDGYLVGTDDLCIIDAGGAGVQAIFDTGACRY